MTRILLIDGDRAFGRSVALACIADGIAVRLAETLCEGVRYMVDGPVSVVLIEASLMRLPAGDQARLFDTVAPGVPVVALVPAGAPVEDTVRLEMQGYKVCPKPFDLRDILAKVDMPARSLPARAGAAARVEALCG